MNSCIKAQFHKYILPQSVEYVKEKLNTECEMRNAKRGMRFFAALRMTKERKMCAMFVLSSLSEQSERRISLICHPECNEGLKKPLYKGAISAKI